MRLGLVLSACLVATLALTGCANANLPPATKTVIVPKVTGMTQEAAANVLKQAGLKVGKVTTAPYPPKADPFVITQDPPDGSPTVPGTAVDLLVAKPTAKP